MQINLIVGSKIEQADGTIAKIDLPIIQGETFLLPLTYQGNVANYTPKGQIRNNYYYANGELLAEFEFLPLIWDEEENTTLITPKISSVVTATIPPTRFQGIGEADPKNCHLYDIDLVDHYGEGFKLVLPSLVQVIPRVTSMGGFQSES